MTDYNTLPEEQKINVERVLMTSGLHGKHFDAISKGEKCAFCWAKPTECICEEE